MKSGSGSYQFREHAKLVESSANAMTCHGARGVKQSGKDKVLLAQFCLLHSGQNDFEVLPVGAAQDRSVSRRNDGQLFQAMHIQGAQIQHRIAIARAHIVIVAMEKADFSGKHTAHFKRTLRSILRELESRHRCAAGNTHAVHHMHAKGANLDQGFARAVLDPGNRARHLLGHCSHCSGQ